MTMLKSGMKGLTLKVLYHVYSHFSALLFVLKTRKFDGEMSNTFASPLNFLDAVKHHYASLKKDLIS